jgi:hypothetical protein
MPTTTAHRALYFCGSSSKSPNKRGANDSKRTNVAIDIPIRNGFIHTSPANKAHSAGPIPRPELHEKQGRNRTGFFVRQFDL